MYLLNTWVRSDYWLKMVFVVFQQPFRTGVPNCHPYLAAQINVANSETDSIGSVTIDFLGLISICYYRCFALYRRNAAWAGKGRSIYLKLKTW